jgi:hypothetical protein
MCGLGQRGEAVMILGCSELLGLPGVNPVGCLSEKVSNFNCVWSTRFKMRHTFLAVRHMDCRCL